MMSSSGDLSSPFTGHLASFPKCSFLKIVFLCILSDVISCSSSSTSPSYSVSGSVDPGKFVYYTLDVSDSPKSLRICLDSHTGDCDLYVASMGMGQASYSNYIAKSDSCGLDEVELGKLLPRPLSVAIYGHPTKTNCTFKLLVYSVNLPDDEYELLDNAYYFKSGKSYDELTKHFQTYDHSDQSNSDKQSIFGAKGKDSRKSYSSRSAHSKSRTANSNPDDMPSSFLGTLLLHLLEIIFDILL